MFPWGNFLAYIAATAITPGPNNLTSLSNASRLGFRKALPFNFGIWAGFSLVMMLCGLLYSALSALIPRIKTPMLVLGAAYMLWMAWTTFRSSGIGEKQARSGFLSGLLLQFVNPKIYIYGVVSMESFILPYYAGNLPALLGFALLLSTVGFCSTLCWLSCGSLLRSLFSRYARITNTVMALLLVYCAVSLFL